MPSIALACWRRWRHCAAPALPWIYATHRLEEAPAGATHRAVLRDGRLRPGAGVRRPRHAAWNAQRAPRSSPRHAPFARRRRARRCSSCGTPRSGATASPCCAVSLQVAAAIAGSCTAPTAAASRRCWQRCTAIMVWPAPARSGAQGHGQGMPLQEFQRRVGRVSPELQAALPRELTAQDCVVAGLRGAFRLDGASRAAERRAALDALRRVGALRYAAARLRRAVVRPGATRAVCARAGGAS